MLYKSFTCRWPNADLSKLQVHEINAPDKTSAHCCCATPYKLAKCHSENPLLKRHRTIKNSSKGLSFRPHPILVVGTFSLLSNSELQNSSGKSELILEQMFSHFLPGFKKFKNTYQSGIIGNTSKKLTSTLDLK